MQICTILPDKSGVESTMQISRHWRLNAQRYRLEGFRNPNGQVSLQPRPAIHTNGNQAEEIKEENITRSTVAVPAG